MNNLDVYFIRLLVTIWYFIFPVSFFCFFLFIREFSKVRDICVVWNPLRKFKAYGYFFHNMFFCFFVAANIFNFLLFIYVLIDTYLLNLDRIYEVVGKVRQDGSNDNRAAFVWGTLFVGKIMHVFVFLFYTYHNFYNTDSYFGEAWRAFIIRFSKSKRFFVLRSRYPRIFAKLTPTFFVVTSVVQKPKEEIVITLN